MSVLSATKPDIWTLSPQMTAAPNLWSQCALLFPLWDRSTTIHDIVGNIRYSYIIDGTSGTPEADLGPNGRRISTNNGTSAASGDYYDISISDYPELVGTDITLWALAHTDYLSSARGGSGDQVLFGTDWDGSKILNYAPYFNDNDRIQLWNGGSAAGNVTFNANQLYNIACILDGASGEFSLYVDGVLDTTLTGFSTFTSSGILRIFNNRDTDPNRSFAGSADIMGVWSRKLSDGEIALLNKDPFAMIRPAGF